jgi:hypothetical protein
VRQIQILKCCILVFNHKSVVRSPDRYYLSYSSYVWCALSEMVEMTKAFSCFRPVRHFQLLQQFLYVSSLAIAPRETRVLGTNLRLENKNQNLMSADSKFFRFFFIDKAKALLSSCISNRRLTSTSQKTLHKLQVRYKITVVFKT